MMNAELRKRIVLSMAAPVTAVLFAVVTSSVILLIADSNPLEAYNDMIQHASKLETMVDILNRATPLYISGVAAAIGFRMNLFNIGVEGQYLLAALFAAAAGGAVSLPTVLHITLIFAVGMIVGSAYAGVAGWMKTSRGINEVISTIMLNGIAISGLLAWLVRRWQQGGEVDATASTAQIGTQAIDESGILPNITSWLELFTRDVRQGKELTGVLLIALLLGIGYHILINRTVFGYDLRASGANPFAARAGGIPPKRMVLYSMLLSGAVAGLVGMSEIMRLGRFNPNFVRGLGFAGIAVALLGRNHPGGIAVAALIFAFLDVSSGILQVSGAASKEIVTIMQGVIILAAVIAYEFARRAKEREEASAAAAALAGGGS